MFCATCLKARSETRFDLHYSTFDRTGLSAFDRITTPFRRAVIGRIEDGVRWALDLENPPRQQA
jgi:hypothetical protein